MKTIELLRDFPVVIELPVQWGDQDALGHVNNVIYFRWWESSRIRFFEHVGMVRRESGASLGSVLASIKCDFRRQLVYPDTVYIGSRTARVGNKSVQVEHCLVSATLNDIAAEAVSTVVMFDFESQQSVPVPAGFRAVLEAAGPGTGPSGDR